MRYEKGIWVQKELGYYKNGVEHLRGWKGLSWTVTLYSNLLYWDSGSQYWSDIRRSAAHDGETNNERASDVFVMGELGFLDT